jgi:LAO/AO transport system kinase
VGVAGPPGAGKSSFIETFGLYVLNNKAKHDESSETFANDAQSNDHNHGASDNRTNGDDDKEYSPSKLAVVCIDPSSSLTGGSILGDKTRMTELSRHDRAFVRPSPNRGTLGGLAAYTNDAITLCQAAGYDLVLVETVGLGQSEIEICEGVDMLLLLVPPGGGDELQGVKKGIVELASMLVVNKADGNLLPAARTTAADYEAAIRFFRHRDDGWDIPPVLLASAKTGEGMERVWDEIFRYRKIMMANGELQKKRQKQNLYWMHKTLRELIIARAKSDPILREKSQQLEMDLMTGIITPRAAAKDLVDSITRAST